MGMLDSITGSLGSLGSVTKMLDVGNMVKTVCDKVLPQNMHFVGDVAGAFVDFKTGNLIGAAQLGMQAMKDLPQAAKGQQQPQATTGNGASISHLVGQNPMLEPSPPPTAKDPKSFDWNDLLSAIKALTEAMTGQSAKPTGDSTTSATSTSSKPADTATKTTDATTAKPASTTPATTNASTPATSTPAPSTSASATTSHSAKEDYGHWRHDQSGWSSRPQTAAAASASQTPASAWQGQPQTPALSTTSDATSASAKMSAEATSTASSTLSARSASAANGAAHTSPTAATSSAAPAASTATPAPAADHPAAASSTTAGASAAKPSASGTTPVASSAANGQTVTSVAQLNGMTDAAFLDAVRNGRISSDVAKDPTAMMAVQERMNEITQMNNLMTGMMRAIHDMQMAVIQNIRI